MRFAGSADEDDVVRLLQLGLSAQTATGMSCDTRGRTLNQQWLSTWLGSKATKETAREYSVCCA